MEVDTDGLIKSAKVLVVDEYEKERLRICGALEKYGFLKDNLFCCCNVDEAEEFVETVDIIFLEASEKRCEDAGGYDMHGVVARWQNKDKTVFLSAYRNDLGKFTRIAAIYSEQFIPKPLNEFNLMGALDTWSQLAMLETLINEARKGEHCGIRR